MLFCNSRGVEDAGDLAGTRHPSTLAAWPTYIQHNSCHFTNTEINEMSAMHTWTAMPHPFFFTSH
jgi:hypothetical protein